MSFRAGLFCLLSFVSMIVVTSALELLLGSSRNTVLFTFAKHYGQKEPVSTILSQAWDRPVGRGVISREWSSGLGGRRSFGYHLARNHIDPTPRG